MSKMYGVFFAVFVLFFLGIQAFFALTNKEKWALTKITAYAIICAMLTTLALITVVFLF